MNVLTAVVPVLVMMLIGIMCRRHNLISGSGMTEIKSLISNVMLPVTLFNALGSANYSKDTAVLILIILLVEILAMAAGYLLRGLVKGPYAKFLPILLTTAENGMLGYPLYIILCGQSSLGNMATIDIAVTAFGFSIWSSMITQIDSGEPIQLRRIGTLALHNPCLWGVCLGILAGLTGLMDLLLGSSIAPLYSGIETMITAPLSALILIALGFDLVFEKNKIKEVLKFVGLRFAVQMLLLAFTWILIGRSASYEMQTALILFFFLPVAFSCQVYVRKEESKSFVATFSSLYSLISIAAFAVLAMVR